MFGLSLGILIGLAVFVGILVLAMVKGGPAERWAATIYLFLLIISIVFNAPKTSPVHAVNLILDALVAFALLALAVRYSNLWLAAAMITQGLLFGVHAYRLGLDETVYWQGMNLPILLSNILQMILMVLLVGGTLFSWRKRSRQKRLSALAALNAAPAAA